MAANLAQSSKAVDRARGIATWQLMNFVKVQPAGKGLPISRLLDRIRRLVRLGDDRDLRQLPSAAQSIDAVRLMTIHGAKGLEFPVVHLPGLNTGTLPRAMLPLGCPPPLNMIEGDGGDTEEPHRREHEKEQECLFYVALSRARDRIFMYAAARNAIGHKRALSKFISRLGTDVEIAATMLSRSVPEAPEDGAIELVMNAGLSLADYEVSLYHSCQRRFFYTYVLQVGGKRTLTPFMQMHDAVRTTVQSLIQGSDSSPESIANYLDQTFSFSGLAQHGYAGDYLEMAKGMMSFFASIRQGHTTQRPIGMSLTVGGEQIVVLPDDVLVAPDGHLTFRRIRTGHSRKSDLTGIGATAFLLASRQSYPDAKVEYVYLSDQAVHPLIFTPKQLEGGSIKLAASLESIRSGVFRTEPSSRVCPACPAFFVCGPIPPGQLHKNF